jgi:hypothetical protein
MVETQLMLANLNDQERAWSEIVLRFARRAHGDLCPRHLLLCGIVLREIPEIRNITMDIACTM